MRLDIED
jgi:hypothetical protein